MEVQFYWCNVGTSDKVWGYATTSETLYLYWGKRGAPLLFQQHPIATHGAFKKKALTKTRKGYVFINPDQVEKVWPDFEHEMQQQLLVTKLSGSFRYQEE